jgi:beta-aspartyl-peptidase (threonine type)
VGAVAFARGHVAAATSTGGRVNKSIGRVGDSSLLGAGNYADDGAGACSATGDGEAIMRVCLAKTVIEWLRAGQPAAESARGAMRMMRDRTGGNGGLILTDARGGLAWARGTATMSWAACADGRATASGH